MIINFFGDFCQEGRTKEYFKDDVVLSLKGIREILSCADYNIVNLECVPDTHRGNLILKTGPHLSCTESAIHALKDCGFNCLALANNHFADYGPEAVKDSIRLIDSLGFDHVGAGNDLSDAERTLYVDIHDKKIAIINCCEHEFSVATPQKAGCNPLNHIAQYKSIQEAKQKADYVFVYVHGGSEHYDLPTPRMQETYRFFIDCGADLVVNCHQHCFSGYEYYNDKPIVYGLGNFYLDSPQRHDTPWNYGYVLQVVIENDLAIKLIPYKQCSETPEVSLLDHKEKEIFENRIQEINKIIDNPNSLRNAYAHYAAENTFNYLYPVFPPVKETRFQRLWRRVKKKFFKIDSPIRENMTESQKLILYNYLNCEAHRDMLLAILRKSFDKD